MRMTVLVADAVGRGEDPVVCNDGASTGVRAAVSDPGDLVGVVGDLHIPAVHYSRLG